MATGEKPSLNEYDKVVQKWEQLKKDAKNYAQGLFDPTKAKDIKELNIIQDKLRLVETAYIMWGWQAFRDKWLSRNAENQAAYYRDNFSLSKTKSDKQDAYKAFLTWYLKYKEEFKK